MTSILLLIIVFRINIYVCPWKNQFHRRLL